MEKHDWQLDDAQSISEFFENNSVPADKRRWNVKPNCKQYQRDEDNEVVYDDEGEPIVLNEFAALRLANGKKVESGPAKGKDAFVFFCLSKNLIEQGYELSKEFVKAHKDDIRLLEPVDDLKYGVIFLANSDEIWED